jgi:hypothetical protein
MNMLLKMIGSPGEARRIFQSDSHDDGR